MRFSASGENFEEAAEVYAANYEMPELSIRPSETNFRWSHTATGDEVMTFRKNQMFATLTATISTGNEFVVGWALTGQSRYESGRVLVEPAINVPFIMPHGSQTMFATSLDATEDLIHIDKGFVEGVAEELPDADFETFEVFAPAAERALRMWRRTVNLVAGVVLDTATPQSSLLRKEMARLVAVAMLETFPYRASDPLPHSSGTEPLAVRLAVDFIHDNPHLPITTADIAAAAGLSVRSLQSALRRYRETTPNALLISTRLAQAHAELTAADPRSESVATIARQWGFLHLGRFSATYYKQYGQLPSRTLHESTPR